MEGVEYICFSGAGTGGTSYFGLLCALEKHSNFATQLKTVKGFAGTSIGTLCALALLLRMPTSDMLDLMIPIMSSFDNIAPILDISLLITNYGLDDGAQIKNVIHTILEKNGLSRTITFKTLKQYFSADFVCVATNLATMTHEYLSVETYPDMLISDALFMSMCVPFLFAPMEYRGALFVDGALSMNVPQCFPYERTLSVQVSTSQHKTIANWPQYIGRLFACGSSSMSSRCQGYKDPLIIQLPPEDNATIDFNITQTTVKRLIRVGYVAGIMRLFPSILHAITTVLTLLTSHHVEHDSIDMEFQLTTQVVEPCTAVDQYKETTFQT